MNQSNMYAIENFTDTIPVDCGFGPFHDESGSSINQGVN